MTRRAPEWQDLTDAYLDVVGGGQADPAARLDRAVAFDRQASALAERPGGLDALREGLGSADPYEALAAARALSVRPEPAVALAIVDRYRSGGSVPLDERDLRRLPSEERVFAELAALHQAAGDLGAQRRLLPAVVRQDLPAARRLAARVMEGSADAWQRRTVVEQLGTVRQTAHGQPEPDDLVRAGLGDADADVRLAAAFVVALGGLDEGVEALRAAAFDGDASLGSRAEAARRLALLARPEAVEALGALLDEAAWHDPDWFGSALDSALDALAALAAAATAPALLRAVAGLPGDARPAAVELAVALLERVAALAGVDAGVAEEALAEGLPTAAQIDAARERCAEATGALDAALRYADGRPLGVRDLVARLASPHEAVARAAWSNLVAMTGHDLGFDPDDDLIANAPAVLRWQAWAADHADSFEPGRWYAAGRRLPDPVVP